MSDSARTVYSRLHSARMLAWLAWKAGVEGPLVRAALLQAEKHENVSRAGAAFRRAVPWAEVAPRIAGTTSAPVSTPAQLRKAMETLSESSPSTDRFTRAWRRKAVQQERKDVWYRTQKEHWLGWLGDYNGPGAYGRTTRHASAGHVYNRVVNPQMLIWLAEAVGVGEATIRRATQNALQRESMSSMSAAIRKVIPWSEVEQRLVRR